MRSRLVALLAAAVLGAGGGVATALVDRGGSEGEGEGNDGETAFADPLNLGISKVDLDCTGQPVLVVGYGDNAATLQNEVVNTPGEDLRYLETSRSCDTRWTPASSDASPAWVVYRPGDATDLCLARLSEAAHRRDNVTFLVDGVEERAMCLCEVPATEAPVLEVGRPAATDDRQRIWIGELQDMLIRIDAELRPTAEIRLVDPDDRTGQYDQETAERIDVVRDNADLPENGVLDATIWNRITSTGCPLYDYR